MVFEWSPSTYQVDEIDISCGDLDGSKSDNRRYYQHTTTNELIQMAKLYQLGRT